MKLFVLIFKNSIILLKLFCIIITLLIFMGNFFEAVVLLFFFNILLSKMILGSWIWIFIFLTFENSDRKGSSALISLKETIFLSLMARKNRKLVMTVRIIIGKVIAGQITLVQVVMQ